MCNFGFGYAFAGVADTEVRLGTLFSVRHGGNAYIDTPARLREFNRVVHQVEHDTVDKIAVRADNNIAVAGVEADIYILRGDLFLQ